MTLFQYELLASLQLNNIPQKVHVILHPIGSANSVYFEGNYIHNVKTEYFFLRIVCNNCDLKGTGSVCGNSVAEFV